MSTQSERERCDEREKEDRHSRRVRLHRGRRGASAGAASARRDHGTHRQHPCRQDHGRGVSAFIHAGPAAAEGMGAGRLDEARRGLLRIAAWYDAEIIAAVLAANPGIKILDMSADFRLRDMKTYAQWYGHEHRAPALQGEAVYGLTEFYRKKIAS